VDTDGDAGTDESVQIEINATPALKEAIIARAAERGWSMRDTAVEVIARHYGRPFTPEPRKSRPRSLRAPLMLVMSAELKLVVQLDAIEKHSNLQDTITTILCREFGLRPPVPRSGRTTPFGGGPRTPRKKGTNKQH
jgi:hypothetical protein